MRLAPSGTYQESTARAGPTPAGRSYPSSKAAASGRPASFKATAAAATTSAATTTTALGKFVMLTPKIFPIAPVR